jgi:hypothetical protein
LWREEGAEAQTVQMRTLTGRLNRRMEAGGHRILGKKENMNNPDPEVKCADLDLSFFQRGVLLYVELNLYL